MTQHLSKYADWEVNTLKKSLKSIEKSRDKYKEKLKWINVKKKLPKVFPVEIKGDLLYYESKKVPVQVKGFEEYGTAVYHLSKDKSYSTWRINENYWMTGNFEVISWFNIPKPPKQKG